MNQETWDYILKIDQKAWNAGIDLDVAVNPPNLTNEKLLPFWQELDRLLDAGAKPTPEQIRQMVQKTLGDDFYDWEGVIP
ncbi:hypothetical protein [Limisphaera sp. VF-2]|uniref:hypothetical protein n=1 Tax=Limisphaera sp. VF-2 TaxID=3400418 RepID=UPI00175A352C|nr:hypothetical protein [Limisphaera sp.]